MKISLKVFSFLEFIDQFLSSYYLTSSESTENEQIFQIYIKNLYGP